MPKKSQKKATKKKTAEELRTTFLQLHRAWEAVNNPEGIQSGKCKKAWRKRLTALGTLVRAK